MTKGRNIGAGQQASNATGIRQTETEWTNKTEMCTGTGTRVDDIYIYIQKHSNITEKITLGDETNNVD
jgi:hypothetical protein